MSSHHSRISSGGDPRASNHSIDHATGSEYATTGGASSRLSNVATVGNTESPPPLPTTHDISTFPGLHTSDSNVETVKPRSRPLSLATNSRGPEAGPLSRSAGSLPLERLQRASSEMLGGSGTTTPGSSHLASLSSRAFLAPMSSQQLQMHRNQRPVSQDPAIEYDDGRISAANRNSTGSGFTIRTAHAIPTQYETDTVPSESRATSRASERSEWAVTNDADRDRDFREFIATQQPQTQADSDIIYGQHEETNTQTYQDYINQEQYIPDLQNRREPQRQRSFMSGGTKRESLRSAILGPPVGHLQLLSAEASPRLTTMDQQRELVKENLGRNYEYFTGNTKFFWGGRLQNAKDRPVVLATALIIIVPAVLFFVFS